MRRVRLARLIAPLSALVLAGGVALAQPAAAAPTWAPADTATVHPGVQTYTEGAGQCTSNFVFTDGVDTFIGQAAHCSSTSPANVTDGCIATSLPEGTRVEVTGASKPGVMVYNSWIRMQAAGEKDASTCQYNDFALIKLDPADVAVTNPSVPFFGGPTALRTAPTSFGETVASYGNSSLRFGLQDLSPKYGRSLGTGSNGWTHTVYTVTPGIPGDSGSGFLDASGKAFGTLSTLAAAPLTGSNGVGDLARELAYAQAHGVSGLALVPGTEPFSGAL